MPAAFVVQQRTPERRKSSVGRGIAGFGEAVSEGITEGFAEKQRRSERDKELGIQERQARTTEEALNFRRLQHSQQRRASELKALMKFRQARPTEFKEAMFQDDGSLTERGTKIAEMILASQGLFIQDPEDLDPDNFVTSVLGSPELLTDEENELAAGLLDELTDAMESAGAVDEGSTAAIELTKLAIMVKRLRKRGIDDKTIDRIARDNLKLLDPLLSLFAFGGKGKPGTAARRSRVSRILRTGEV